MLIACEYSGTVRDAFLARGHEAVSCDLLPTERPGPHIQRDIRTAGLLENGWDLLIAHPPCTHLAVSGARWFAEKAKQGPHPELFDMDTEPATQAEAIEFVRTLLAAPIPRIALENPVSILSSAIRKPDQIVHPWQHGHPIPKATCLWLKQLPPLHPTNVVTPTDRYGIRDQPPGPRRRKDRSRTFPGIAAAMADQWGALE